MIKVYDARIVVNEPGALQNDADVAVDIAQNLVERMDRGEYRVEQDEDMRGLTIVLTPRRSIKYK